MSLLAAGQLALDQHWQPAHRHPGAQRDPRRRRAGPVDEEAITGNRCARRWGLGQPQVKAVTGRTDRDVSDDQQSEPVRQRVRMTRWNGTRQLRRAAGGAAHVERPHRVRGARHDTRIAQHLMAGAGRYRQQPGVWRRCPVSAVAVSPLRSASAATGLDGLRQLAQLLGRQRLTGLTAVGAAPES